MRQLAIAIIAVVASIAAIAVKGAEPKAAPSIEFATKAHDFGTIQEKNGPVSCAFEFTNTGTAPLVIISAKTSCGCTTPSFPKRPIEPGKTGEITVKYNPAGRPGEFDKRVTVRTNVKGRDSRIRLRLTGTVIPRP